MSFQEIIPGSREFVGLRNYRALSNPIFQRAVTNSFIYMFFSVILVVIIPMILACLLNSKKIFGRNVLRSMYFIPILVSTIVAGTIFRLIFGELPGALLNQIIGLFGFEPMRWLMRQDTAYVALVAVTLWRWTGVNMLYYLAGLQSIPTELYESASIDGAGGVQQFWHITVPLVKNITVFITTISILGSLAMFAESFVLFGGNNSPNNIGLTIVGYLYRNAFERFNTGYAAAIGLFLLVVVLAVNTIQLAISGHFKKEV